MVVESILNLALPCLWLLTHPITERVNLWLKVNLTSMRLWVSIWRFLLISQISWQGIGIGIVSVELWIQLLLSLLLSILVDFVKVHQPVLYRWFFLLKYVITRILLIKCLLLNTPLWLERLVRHWVRVPLLTEIRSWIVRSMRRWNGNLRIVLTWYL